MEDELDTLDTFVALDTLRLRLIHVVKDEFGMTTKIEFLIEELDRDKDGKFNYSEFSAPLA